MAKKITSIALAMVLLITCSLGATTALAAESNDNTGQNETIVIDGSLYEFEEAYWNGMPATYINNLTENTRDVVYYDEANGTIYWNGEPMAYIEKVSTTLAEPETGISLLAADHWTYDRTETSRVTWAQGASIFAVAEAISIAVGLLMPAKLTALAVIIDLGLGKIQSLAKDAIGGTLQIDQYYHIYTDGRIQYRWDWSLTDSNGKHYGPFPTYSDSDFS